MVFLLGLWPIQNAESAYPKVEILRDPWGIPHVFAESDGGAFYGLGYAMAEDRGFQMTYSLRIIQGRLSELVGNIRMLNRNDTSIAHDQKMRTFGFDRAAKRTAANLDPNTFALLQSFCDGINDYFNANKGKLHPLFARTGLEVEPWTPADCLASWWHLGQFFATDGTREVIAGRNSAAVLGERSPRPQARGDLPGRALQRQSMNDSGLIAMPPDDEPAVVKRSDVSETWVKRVDRYAREHGLIQNGEGGDGPKFSHAWVVGRERTTTGSSVLVSDPQTPVRNPSLFYEFHIKGRNFNARGIGVPGSPILLIGFTENVAWGVTALGADQADLFFLKTDPSKPDQYYFDGNWRPMAVFEEVIKVRGQESIRYPVRETVLGPVATAFCFTQPGEGDVAMKRIPLCETNRETIQSAIAMMKARTAVEFESALSSWQFPCANMVFGDRQGNIGYKAVAAIPVRSSLDPMNGRYAMPGHRQDQDWQDILPAGLLPAVLNPAVGYLYSGNHRPIESWYPIPLGAMTGAGGDTIRSWRLGELLKRREKFTPDEVRAIHFDSVNPARREIVHLGLHLRDTLKKELTPDALNSLSRLESWYRNGASSSLSVPGSELAIELNTFFRFVTTELALVYGGGESGLAYFLKSAKARLDKNPQATVSEMEEQFIDQSLASAWQSAQQKYGDDPEAWNKRARAEVQSRRLGYYESLDGFPALDTALALSFPPINVTDGGVIGCQSAQSYTQYVPMHDPDQAQSILPIGQSEHPDNPMRTSTLKLWGEGRLHPAPLSRAKVESLGITRVYNLKR